MAVFPTYARILDDGYSEEADYGVLRTEMDGGIAKQRARFSKPIITMDVKIQVMSYADKERFDEWIKTDLSGGAGWFDWTNPESRKTLQTRIVGGKYKWGKAGGTIWVAPCQIETIG